MKLSLNHECDQFCNYEDEAHKELRRRYRSNAITRTRQSADQAWSTCRRFMNDFKFIKNNLKSGHILSEEEAILTRMCINTVLGELLLRDADLINKFSD